ncbi:MAG: hypothetical protein EA353_14690, partial [Puniceicoccaceae bacterium]
KLSGRATFIAPGHQLLTKTLRIPHVEDSKRAQIVAFEAQQNIPYPLSEVVWDTQVVGDDGVETEVLFIAAKADTIDRFCSEVSGFGLVPEAISAVTVLDYNAFKAAYPNENDDVLLINIGARSSNLLFCNPEGFFVRNIQLGGNSLTQAIADSIGKPFAQAENLKVRFFSGDTQSNGGESTEQLINSAAEGFMKKMNQEITRSIVNYRRQKGGKAPKRILLTGRGSLVPALSEFLSEKQSMDVEYFDPLNNVSVDGGVDLDFNILRLQIGEIVGEAVRPTLANAAGVNLLPEEIQSSMEFAGRKPFLALAAVCLALSPFPAWMVYTSNAAEYRESAGQIEQTVSPVRTLTQSIAETSERAESIRDTIQLIEGLVDSKSNWLEFLGELQESLFRTEDVWLDELRVNRRAATDGRTTEYTVTLRGRMLIRESVREDAVDEDALARRIQTLIDSFADSRFIVSAGTPNITWTSIAEGLNVLPFSINLVVDPTKPL